jgi:RNA polymerase sigma-70 factor, ECF subfamily
LLGTETWRTVNDRAGAGSQEDALLKAARSGDAAAMERLLGQYETGLLSLSKGVLGRAEDAEDAVQETYLRALRSLGGFRGGSAFKTWLYRIALNVCLEWKRARRPVETLTDERVQTMNGPAPDVLSRMRMASALASLMPRHRAVILLRELHGFSVAEIAETMRWPQNRVQNELYKARKALAEWRRREDQEGERI